MKVKEITSAIEQFAPLSLQESYDNSGLIVGRESDDVHRALLAVDITDEVMDEAEREGCDMIITHHPIIFQPLKRFNSSNYVERCVERAIRNGVTLYACHTNLDSTSRGMSWHLASILGVTNLEVLQPLDKGNTGIDAGVGFGAVGDLVQPMEAIDFLRTVQHKTKAQAIRHSQIIKPLVRRVAVCTGAGSFLIDEVKKAQADIYITSDLKYNDFMTPDKCFVVADIGHFESEYCAIDILYDILSKNLCTFATRKSECSQNPIHYLV